MLELTIVMNTTKILQYRLHTIEDLFLAYITVNWMIGRYISHHDLGSNSFRDLRILSCLFCNWPADNEERKNMENLLGGFWGHPIVVPPFLSTCPWSELVPGPHWMQGERGKCGTPLFQEGKETVL